MKAKIGLLAALVLGLGVVSAVFGYTQQLSSPPLQGAMLENEPEPGGTPPPPPGCRLLAFTTEPKIGGTVTVDTEPNCGATWYTNGTVVTLTAVPAPGYSFSHWVNSPAGPGGSGSTAPILTLTMNNNQVAIANFMDAPPPPPGCRLLQFTSNPSDGGTVSASPEPNCGAAWYMVGTDVTLTAFPANNYNFAFWTVNPATGGSGSTNPVIVITMDDNYTAVANFQTVLCYQIATEANPPEGGEVSVDPSTPENCPNGPGWLPGSPVILNVLENVGYEFVDWTDSAGVYTGNTNNPLVIGSGELNTDRTLTADFTFTSSCYDIATQINPPGEGTVTFNPPRGTDCPGGWVAGNVQITAVPDEPTAYQFDSWGGDASPNGSTNPGTLAVTGNMNITATFVQIADAADLYVQKVDITDPVAVGEQFLYVLIIGNNGPDTAGDIDITDILPPSATLAWTMGSAFGCNIAANVVTCELPQGLSAGSSWPIFISVLPNSVGTITNTASVASADPTIIDTNSTNNSDSETTEVLHQPIIGLTAINNSPTALGSSTIFTASVTAGTGVTYIWNYGDGSLGTGAVSSHTYPGSSYYTATVTATNPVSTVVTETIVSVEEAITDLTAENNSPTALGMTTTLTASVTAGTSVSYTWDFGDGSVGSGADTSYTYAAAGTYTATVTATNNVSSAAAETIVIIEEAISGLTATNNSPTTLGMTTTLTATINGGTNVSYTWDFGDGQTGAGPQVTHLYANVGVYTVTVTATNAVSTQVVTTVVTVEAPAFIIFMPAIAKP